NAGAPLIDLETQQVLGLQTTSRYLDVNTAVPLYALRDDPLLRRAGVSFAQATEQERRDAAEQLERLARTRFWNEARAAIATLYQRASGSPPPAEPKVARDSVADGRLAVAGYPRAERPP